MKKQIKIRSIKIWAAFLTFILTACFTQAVLADGGSGELLLRCVRRPMSYHENVITAEAPADGELQISILDEDHLYRTLTAAVKKGENRIPWDGLGWNGERLSSKVYQITGSLTGDNGKKYTAAIQTFVDYSAQALIFGLPSGDSLTLDDPGSWFVEAKTVLNGTVELRLYGENKDDPVLTVRKDVQGGKILRLTFPEIRRTAGIEAGEYTAVLYEISNPDYASRFPLRIHESLPEPEPLRVTGNIMPERGDSDAEIWKKMQESSVVVDIPYLQHQVIYALPDENSGALGTLHGQTQALSIFELRDGWARIGAWNHEEAEYTEGWVPAKNLKTVHPQGPYGLLLDKKEQTLKIYQNGKVIETLQVSTGRMEKDELYQETAAGSFLTGLHRTDFSTNGQKYDFVIQYDGGNLLHQIPYAWGNDRKDFTEGRALLGTKGSHACIRIQADPGKNGLNAYWIWTHIPYRTRLIILDDPEERRASAMLSQGKTPAYEDSMLVDSFMEEHDEETQGLVLTFGGDAVLGGREGYLNRRDSFFAAKRETGFQPFSELRSVFSRDQWTCVNLECVLKADSTGEDMTKTWRFRGFPEYAELLPEGSVEMVNIANNHTIDYGEEGMTETLQALAGKAEVCGLHHNTIVSIEGHLFGFGGCRETAYKQNPTVIEQDISELREKGAEVVIYQCHWGTEYDTAHNALQEAMARACVRAGADAVIGHHSHVVQGIDVISGVPVIYSLGNCCFGGTIRLTTYDAMLAQLEFVFRDTKKPDVYVRLIPILTSGRAQEGVNDYRPVIAGQEDSKRIMQTVQADTPFRLREVFAVVPDQ